MSRVFLLGQGPRAPSANESFGTAGCLSVTAAPSIFRDGYFAYGVSDPASVVIYFLKMSQHIQRDRGGEDHDSI